MISGEKTFNEIVVRGPSDIYVVPGASGLRKMADLSEAELRGIIQLFSEFKEPLDYLIVDVSGWHLSHSIVISQSLPPNFGCHT